ncbi:MAG TPA: hypothetical protein VHV57_09950 [Acidimicrobiales bacterium]|nr:hypothetical protein [Acidimicrobiales bacterium]
MQQPVPDDTSAVQQPSAAVRKWLASGGAQGHPTSYGGPFGRRKVQRRLEALNEATTHEARPPAAMTHVHIIEVPDSPDAIVEREPSVLPDEVSTPVTP